MKQMSLFDEPTIVLPVNYYPEFLSKEEADELYQHCQELQWQQNTIRMLGKTMPVPRLECIYGDEGCDYLYSKSVLLKPLPEQFAIRNSQFAIMEEFVNLFIWDTEQIISIMKKITTYYQYSEQAHLWVGKEIANGRKSELRIGLTGYSFRIVIGNQYRSGQDSIGWHSDNEQSMGFNPAIASVSLGSCRKFQIKPIGGRPTDFWLEHGSLLVMHPGCQSTHLHQVPKTTKVVSTRINLTFRPHIGGKR